MEDNSTPSTNGSDLNGETSNQENDLQMDGDNVNEDLLSDLLNDIRIDHSLQSPDMTAVKRESYKRTRAAMVVSSLFIGIHSIHCIARDSCQLGSQSVFLLLFIHQGLLQCLETADEYMLYSFL